MITKYMPKPGCLPKGLSKWGDVCRGLRRDLDEDPVMVLRLLMLMIAARETREMLVGWEGELYEKQEPVMVRLCMLFGGFFGFPNWERVEVFADSVDAPIETDSALDVFLGSVETELAPFVVRGPCPA